MYVMLTQKLSKGFVSWKNMLQENKAKIEEHGMMGFKNDAELAKAREDTGALTETTVMTPLSEEAVVNFPKAI